ncbi:hypothetical protein [Xenophilus sp. Marseille-Q4582]|uniref:hypothetical protein n=1 Tax=Xenophilus sp. Marseille-Q4582 TaxID=2866600 RepID=UPI001CE487CA|nr:hypothetical protein [Xenophilus sp. Marseille-Q4582]
MKQVEAIQNFEHGSRRRRGEQFGVTEQHAEQLERAGLVRIVGAAPADPSEAAGAKPSASPAAPASPEQTVKPRGRGAKQAQGAASS